MYSYIFCKISYAERILAGNSFVFHVASYTAYADNNIGKGHIKDQVGLLSGLGKGVRCSTMLNVTDLNRIVCNID